jgi:hypothetical protein
MALIKLNNQSLTAVTSAGIPIRSGSVLQVKQTVVTASVSQAVSNQANFLDISGMSVSITPISTLSKILVTYNVRKSNTSAEQNDCIRLVRGSTNIAISTAGDTVNGTGFLRDAPGTTADIYPESFTFLDSPATTSSTTYKLQWSGSGGTLYLNRRGQDDDFGTVSTLTLMEIAG